MTSAVLAGACLLALAGCASPGSATRPGNDAATTYRAIGQEPAWQLRVTDAGLYLELGYGTRSLHWTQSQVEPTRQGRRYLAAEDGSDLRVEVRHALCHDIMSGMPYPDRVQVHWNDTQLAGCGGQPASLLVGPEWVVEDLSGHGVIDFARVTLQFSPDGTVAGSTGCNRWHASWQLSGEGLHIGAAATTRMACAPALNHQQQRFLAVLDKVRRFDIDAHGKLVLHAGPDHSLRASRDKQDS